jgi:Trk K+ transport system NAD-binding subunit
MGRHVYEGLSNQYRHILVVDHDPSVIKQLNHDGRDAIYADMGDTELYASILDGSNAVVVSTIPDVSVSTMLIQYIKRVHPHLRVCVTADMHEHAMMLYEAGADYVLLPHIVAADHIQGVVTRLSQGESIGEILGQK